MNNRLSICILLCLAILASGQAAAQGTYGTKVQAGDPDVGLPLSNFAAIPGPNPAATAQNTAYLSYWDIGSTPGLYDDQDVVYLQFGSGAGAARIVRANNIRMTGWGNYLAGSYVKPGDSDIGQQLLPWVPPGVNPTNFASFILTGFYYMNVAGGVGYDISDPVYIKAAALPITNTNDIRVTSNDGFQAGSRVSLNDPDSSKPLIAFYSIIPFAVAPAGGPTATAGGPIAQLSFFNANGNSQGPFSAIFDDGDVVYFDTNPVGIVSPNDIRLF